MQSVIKELQNFVKFAAKELSLSKLPKIHFVDDPKFAKKIAAFGQIKDNRIVIDIAGRQTMDILRTVAHELTHRRQDAQGRIKVHSPPGSKLEREADEQAGILMKLYGKMHPEIIQ